MVLEPDEEPLVEVVAELDEEPLVEVVPVVGEDPDPDVLTAADAMPAPWVAPLLPPHAASTSKAALTVSAAAQFPSDKIRFIRVILRCDCARELCSRDKSSAACLRAETVAVVRLFPLPSSVLV